MLAVENVSFHIRPGEILGYLGPNGSGKSTTINMVVGLLEPSAGTLSLYGQSLYQDACVYKRRIGYVPEEPYLYTHLTAVEDHCCLGSPRHPADDCPRYWFHSASEHLHLWDSRYQAMTGFSKGMRQRVLLAAALLHGPDLLVLDEPFSGLDVNAAHLFQTLLRLFVRSGRMILFSSHRFDVVERVCSRVVILHGGRIVAEDTVQELQRSIASRSLEDVFARVTQQEDYTEVAEKILSVTNSPSP